MRGGGAWLDFGPSSDLASLGHLLPVPGRRERVQLRGLSARRWRAARSGVARGPTASGVEKVKPGGRQAPPLRARRLKDERKIPGRFQPLRASLVGPCLPSAASNRVVSPAFGGRRPWSTSSRCRRPSVDQSMDRVIGILSACQASSPVARSGGDDGVVSRSLPLILRSVAPGRCVSKDEGSRGRDRRGVRAGRFARGGLANPPPLRYSPPRFATAPRSAGQSPLGDSSTVEQRTLTPLILVRIQVPQPNLRRRSQQGRALAACRPRGASGRLARIPSAADRSRPSR